MRLRSLFWLIVLLAFVVPPILAGKAAAAMHDHTAMASMAHCPDHAPPPAPCPAKGTAKHAAGECCPMMSGAMAVLPVTVVAASPARLHVYLPAVSVTLSGLLFTTDPPPPRT